MLNKKDLEFINCEPNKLKTLLNINSSNLLECIAFWLKEPELNSNASRIEDYENLTKEAVLLRMKVIDWPNGLRACQIGHLKLLSLSRKHRANWKSMRLSNAKENIRLHLNKEEIRDRLEDYLSNFFHCYIYTEYHQYTNTYIFSLSIVEKNKDPHDYNNMRFGFMAYFPGTEFVISPSNFWVKDYDRYYKEALLETFNAVTLHSESTSISRLSDLKNFTLQSKAESIFMNDQSDANPLDIRQKKQIGYSGDSNDLKRKKALDSYIKQGEQRKRIVPIDIDELEDRLDNRKHALVYSEMEGINKLDIDLDLPFQPNHPLEEHNFTDGDIVKISICMQGSNVAEGVRDLIRYGVLQLPAPVWLESIGISGAKKLTVNEEGVFTDEGISVDE